MVDEDLYGWKKTRSSERLEEEERDCTGSILSSPGLEKEEDSWQEESNHVEEESIWKADDCE